MLVRGRVVDNGAPLGERKHWCFRRRPEQGNAVWRERRGHVRLPAHGYAREPRSFPCSNYGLRRFQPMDVSLLIQVCVLTRIHHHNYERTLWYVEHRRYRPWRDATDLYYTLVKQLGCDAWAKPLDCMLSKSTRTLLNVSDSYYGVCLLSACLPTLLSA